MIDFELWKNALLKPSETYKKKGGFSEAVKQLVIAGLIGGFFTGLGSLIGLSAGGSYGSLAGLIGPLAFIGSLILTPIVAVIVVLIVSVVLYVMAMILGGKGKFESQTYYISVYYAPIIILTSIFSLIPVAGGILSLLLGLYSLYLLTMAMKYTHSFTIMKAVLTWLIPCIVIVGLIVLVAGAAFLAIFGGGRLPLY